MLAWAQGNEKDVLKDRVKADTVKELLAVIDSFEMAKGQLKPESEGEKKIDAAYQVPVTRQFVPSMLTTPACGLLVVTCSRWPPVLVHVHKDPCSQRTAVEGPVHACMWGVTEKARMCLGGRRAWQEGRVWLCVQGVYKQMVEVFRSLGVEAVPGVGQPFDPEVPGLATC